MKTPSRKNIYFWTATIFLWGAFWLPFNIYTGIFPVVVFIYWKRRDQEILDSVLYALIWFLILTTAALIYYLFA